MGFCIYGYWPLTETVASYSNKCMQTSAQPEPCPCPSEQQEGYSLKIPYLLSLPPLGPSALMEQQLPLWLQLQTGSLRRFQLHPPRKKAWHSDPQRLLCRDACSLILLCATAQPWCPTSVNASSIVCFKNPKPARSGSLSLFLRGSFLSQRQVVSLYSPLDLIDRNLSHLLIPSSHSSF